MSPFKSCEFISNKNNYNTLEINESYSKINTIPSNSMESIIKSKPICSDYKNCCSSISGSISKSPSVASKSNKFVRFRIPDEKEKEKLKEMEHKEKETWHLSSVDNESSNGIYQRQQHRIEIANTNDFNKDFRVYASSNLHSNHKFDDSSSLNHVKNATKVYQKLIEPHPKLLRSNSKKYATSNNTIEKNTNENCFDKRVKTDVCRNIDDFKSFVKRKEFDCTAKNGKNELELVDIEYDSQILKSVEEVDKIYDRSSAILNKSSECGSYASEVQNSYPILKKIIDNPVCTDCNVENTCQLKLESFVMPNISPEHAHFYEMKLEQNYPNTICERQYLHNCRINNKNDDSTNENRSYEGEEKRHSKCICHSKSSLTKNCASVKENISQQNIQWILKNKDEHLQKSPSCIEKRDQVNDDFCFHNYHYHKNLDQQQQYCQCYNDCNSKLEKYISDDNSTNADFYTIMYNTTAVADTTVVDAVPESTVLATKFQTKHITADSSNKKVQLNENRNELKWDKDDEQTNKDEIKAKINCNNEMINHERVKSDILNQFNTIKNQTISQRKNVTHEQVSNETREIPLSEYGYCTTLEPVFIVTRMSNITPEILPQFCSYAEIMNSRVPTASFPLLLNIASSSSSSATNSAHTSTSDVPKKCTASDLTFQPHVLPSPSSSSSSSSLSLSSIMQTDHFLHNEIPVQSTSIDEINKDDDDSPLPFVNFATYPQSPSVQNSPFDCTSICCKDVCNCVLSASDLHDCYSLTRCNYFACSNVDARRLANAPLMPQYEVCLLVPIQTS